MSSAVVDSVSGRSRVIDPEEQGPTVKDALARILELKQRFQQKQSPEITEDATLELLESLSRHDGGRSITRQALNTLIVILSNVQTNAISVGTAQKLYRLLAAHNPPNADQGEDLLLRVKILRLTLAKNTNGPEKHDLDSIIKNLARACFYGAKVGSSLAPQPARHTAAPVTRLQMPLNSTMGSFAMPPRPTSSRHVPSRKPSISSITSNSRRSSFSSSRASETDSSDYEGLTKQQDTSMIRLEGLRALEGLAISDTKALHPFWPVFFSPSANPSLLSLAKYDLSLSVRLQAMQTVRALLTNAKGYLDLARESKIKMAFTPLSETLATMANDLNIEITHLLRTHFSMSRPEELLQAGLQLAASIVTVSPFERLSPPHLDNIVTVVVDNATHVSSQLHMRSMAKFLDVVFEKQDSGLKLSTETIHAVLEATQETFSRLTRSQEQAKDNSETGLWELLSSLIRLVHFDSDQKDDLYCKIAQHSTRLFAKSDTEIQEKQLTVVSTLARSFPAASCLHETLLTMLNSIEEVESLVVKSQLGTLLAQQIHHLPENSTRIIDLIIYLANSPIKDVRCQAIRSLGNILQSAFVQSSATISERCFSELLMNVDPSMPPPVRAEAWWNIASTMDSLSSESPLFEHTKRLVPEVIDEITAGGASREAEMIRTSAIRVAGSLLAGLPQLDASTETDVSKALISALLHSSPKTQWNAATALKVVIQSGSGNSAIIQALLDTFLASKNIKVQASIVSALQAFEGHDDQLIDELILGLERIMARPGDVQVDIPYAQVAKAEALNQTIKELSSRLRAHTESISHASNNREPDNKPADGKQIPEDVSTSAPQSM